MDPEEVLELAMASVEPAVGEMYLSLLGNAIEGKPWDFIRDDSISKEGVMLLSAVNTSKDSAIRCFRVKEGFLVWGINAQKLYDWYSQHLKDSFFWSNVTEKASFARRESFKHAGEGLIPGEKKLIGIYNLNSSPTTIVNGHPHLTLPLTLEDSLPQGNWFSTNGKLLNPHNKNDFLSNGEIAPSGRSLLYVWGE